MNVADFDRLLVVNTHLSDFSAIYWEIIFSFKMIEEFGKFYLYIFDCFLLFDPLWQFSFYLLCI